MESSTSKPRTTTNGSVSEELELEDLLLELHALKKLYGLLHKSSDDIVPNGDSHGFLDEKSRVVLKKLLDGATHQALESQAKIVCYTPEPLPAEKTENRELSKIVCYTPNPPPMEKAENGEPKISIEEEASIPEKFQKLLSVSSQQGNAASTQSSKPVTPGHQPSKQPKHNWVVAEPKIQRKSHPTVSRGDLTRQNSRKSTVGPSKRLSHHHHPAHSRHLDRGSLNNKPKNNLENQNHSSVVNAPSRINGELLAIVPAEKRARVEPVGLLAQSLTTQTRIVGQVDRELTHSKRHVSKDTTRLKDPHKSSSKPLSRLGSINERTSNKPPSRLGSIKDQRSTIKPPSRLGSIKDRRTYSVAERDQNHQIFEMHKENKDCADKKIYSIVPLKPRQSRDEIDPPPRQHPSRIPTRKKPIAYSPSSSSSSQTPMRTNTSSSSFSSPQLSTRRAGPAPCGMPSRRKSTVPPPQVKAQKQVEKNREGRLKRFRNKLAVIFHHHHHHHHHLHDRHAADNQNQKQQHRSPWTYLKSVVHHTGGDENGNRNNKVVKAPARARARQQHGYFHALIEGLIRHMWGTRGRKAVGINNRVKGKKRFHWWQRFRRRRVGVKLGNNKKLRLGFNKSQSKNFRIKT